jgi:hypothetical protein
MVANDRRLGMVGLHAAVINFVKILRRLDVNSNYPYISLGVVPSGASCGRLSLFDAPQQSLREKPHALSGAWEQRLLCEPKIASQ